jgi:23S rRNA C2498 (ribose-2'-O)-methylase RlmM
MSELTDQLSEAMRRIDDLLKSIPEADRPEEVVALLEEVKQLDEQVRVAELNIAEEIKKVLENDKPNTTPDLDQ